MIDGPALGGVLVVTFSPAFAFSVDLFTFIVSLIALPDASRAIPLTRIVLVSNQSSKVALRVARSYWAHTWWT
jgi:hypothetical protein